jgi:hypothetical protein
VSAGHLAHPINRTSDSLDLMAFQTMYEGGGPRTKSLHRAMMVKVIGWARATGAFSSRKASTGCTRI